MIAPYYQDDSITLYHGDCRDILPHLSPVDLVLTDPPYGIKEAAGKNKRRGGRAKARDYGDDNWDNEPIPQGLMNQIITQSAIIFGGNYYAMPPSSCWLIWDKLNGKTCFADCEIAWTNLPGAVRKIEHLWNGFLQQRKEYRWHPTQKPLDVMKWCIIQADIKLKKTTGTILDPFAGSGTTLIAAKSLGRKAIGIELEQKYCDIIIKRLEEPCATK